MQSIGSTQYQAALAVSGAWKGSNTSKLYEEFGWESLTNRRWYRRLLHFYKIVKDLTPPYLKDIILPLRRSLYGHQREIFHELRCHSFSLMDSFFPDSIRSWNNIGSEFTSLSPISKFKEAVLSFIRPAKTLYLVFAILPVSKNCFNCHWVLASWKVTKKIIILLIHPPICVFATMRLKIPNISFADTLFFLFKSVLFLIRSLTYSHKKYPYQ